MLHPRARLLSGVFVAAALLAFGPSRTRAATAKHSAVFDSNCSMCHQLGAVGVPGQFPRLAGRIGRIAAMSAGRHYLERVVLFGMMGKITVDGTPIIGGVMPSFASLSNRDLAAALNYVANLTASGKLRWKRAMFSAADFARARAGKSLSPTQVHQLRAGVLAKKGS